MLSKPEEFILAILAGLWVILTYFAAAYMGMPTHTSLLIAALTLIWAMVFFLLWQRHFVRLLWPIFMGLLVACWWPALDWLVIKDLLPLNTTADTIIIGKPWYATWTAKFIYAAVPTLAGYVLMWKLKYRPANHQMTP